MAAGYDGPALVALAGLGSSDLLDDALDECGVQAHSATVGLHVEALATDIARMFAQGRAGYRWIVDKVVEIADVHGEDVLLDLPLGGLLSVGDPTEQMVRDACLEQMVGRPRRR